MNEIGSINGSDLSDEPTEEELVIVDHKPSGSESIESEGQRTVRDCCLDSSDKDEVNNGTTKFPKDSLEKSLPVKQVDPSHEAPLIPT